MCVATGVDAQELTSLVNLLIYTRAAYIASYIVAFTTFLTPIRTGIFMFGMAIIVKLMVLAIYMNDGVFFTLK
jgi:uncharacterized MAPEG superfamily protein